MRIAALVKRIFIQIIRDKRTMALLFVAPLFVLTLMNYVFDGKTIEPTLGIVAGDQQLIEKMRKADIEVKEYAKVSDREDTILGDELDGLLQVSDTKSTLTLLNNDPSLTKSLEMKVKQVYGQEVQAQMLGPAKTPSNASTQDIMKTEYVYGSSDTAIFDTINPVLVGFFVFFFVFLIAGIGLLNERTTGTLDRLLTTPIRRGEVVTAYLIGYGILALIQTIIMVLFAIAVLDIVMVGSIWTVILINIVIALVALSLGILLSSFASSEFQMIQFIPLVIVPQVFFSGIFSIEAMADWLQVFARFMPMYYAADALKGVMYQGLTLADISHDVYILLAFAAVFIVLNLFALKKYRKL